MSIGKSILKTYILEAALDVFFRNLPSASPMGYSRGEVFLKENVQVGMHFGIIRDDLSSMLNSVFYFYDCVIEKITDEYIWFSYHRATTLEPPYELEKDWDASGYTYVDRLVGKVEFVV